MEKIDIRHRSSIQTIEAYENDPIVNHLVQCMGTYHLFGCIDFGIAQLLQYREKMYPKLFPCSVRLENMKDLSCTVLDRAYREVAKEMVKNSSYKPGPPFECFF